MMIDHDCGLIPVVENNSNMKPIGTITDRDIAVRAVASDDNAGELKVSNVMTHHVVTIHPITSVQECSRVMKQNDIRRVLVVDNNGKLVGIVAQADVAQYGPNPSLVSDVVHDISQSSPNPVHKVNSNNERSYNKSHNERSFNDRSENERFYKERSHKQKHFTKKKSLFSLNSVLPLAAGLGAGMAFKYFYGSPGSSTESYTSENKNTELKTKKVVHLPNQPMPASNKKTEVSVSVDNEESTIIKDRNQSTASNTIPGGSIPKTSTFEEMAKENKTDSVIGRGATNS
jgi:hypothetical protein